MDSPGELICQASNSEGNSRVLTRLKVTDVPGGFEVETPEEIVEGDSVLLACRVNLYSFSDKLQW